MPRLAEGRASAFLLDPGRLALVPTPLTSPWMLDDGVPAANGHGRVPGDAGGVDGLSTVSSPDLVFVPPKPCGRIACWFRWQVATAPGLGHPSKG
jgi:hypothetical protein